MGVLGSDKLSQLGHTHLANEVTAQCRRRQRECAYQVYHRGFNVLRLSGQTQEGRGDMVCTAHVDLKVSPPGS